MEHRNSRRIECSIDAHLTYRDVLFPRCKIANANSEGILISASELELPKLVLVRVTLKCGQIRPAVNLRPLVVHSSVGHAGLWFYQDQQDWQKIWRELNKTQFMGEQSSEFLKTPAMLYTG